MRSQPRWRLPAVTGPPEALWAEAGRWRGLPAQPLVRCRDGLPPRQPTRVRAVWSPQALVVRFECRDDEPWATLRERDAPLWQEEVVEVFLAPGAADPERYMELEVNPIGALFDARIRNPGLDRRRLEADAGWDCPGLRWAAGEIAEPRGWWAQLLVPWAAVSAGEPPRLWRANFYRVDRPRDGDPPELTAWSPTLVAPEDFHRPRRFGVLELPSRAGSAESHTLAGP